MKFIQGAVYFGGLQHILLLGEHESIMVLLRSSFFWVSTPKVYR